MNINSNILKAGALGLGAAAGVGVGAALGQAKFKAIGKIAGRPVGLPGSTAHVLTNDKLDKKEYTKEFAKHQLKDTGAALGIAGLAGGIAAGVTKLAEVSTPVGNFITTAKDKAAGLVSKLPKLSEAAAKVADKAKSLGVTDKLNSLPKPVKAAVIAGGAALAAALPVLFLKANADSAYIEAKNETK